MIDVAHDRDNRWPKWEFRSFFCRRLRPRINVERRLLARADNAIVLGGNKLGILQLQEPVWSSVVETNLFHTELEFAHVHVQYTREMKHGRDRGK